MKAQASAISRVFDQHGHPWLVRARTAIEYLSTTAMAIRLVPSAGTGPARGAEQALLLLNTGDDPVKFPVDPGELS
jgi:hypothetical protein